MKKLIIVLTFVLMFSGCNRPDSIHLPQHTFNFGAAEDSYSFECDNYNIYRIIEGNKETPISGYSKDKPVTITYTWFSISYEEAKTSKTTIKVFENTSSEPRSAIVRIGSMDYEDSFTINQKAKGK